MLTGIDHVILAVADTEAAARAMSAALALPVGGGGRHEAHGTLNRIVWLGDSYVELMGVFDPDVAPRSWWGAHMMSVLGAGTDGYAGLVLATDDLAADVERLRASGSILGDPSDGQRVKPDGDVVRRRRECPQCGRRRRGR